MTYINYKYQGVTETIDEYRTRQEAAKMLNEYRQAYLDGELWLSTRCCKDWNN